jgi:hypothetical protein
MKKHHPVNYSVSKDDAGSSEGSGGATHLQRLFQALKGLTGDTRGAQELVDCWAGGFLVGGVTTVVKIRHENETRPFATPVRQAQSAGNNAWPFATKWSTQPCEELDRSEGACS